MLLSIFSLFGLIIFHQPDEVVFGDPVGQLPGPPAQQIQHPDLVRVDHPLQLPHDGTGGGTGTDQIVGILLHFISHELGDTLRGFILTAAGATLAVELAYTFRMGLTAASLLRLAASTALTGLLNPGEEVIIPIPAFPLYESITVAAGAKPVFLDLKKSNFQIDKAALESFMNELMDIYTVEFGGARNAMFRLKEHWGLLIHKFEDADKLWKALRKTTDLSEYRSLCAQILHALPMREEIDRW